jgi:hypothetical protein
LCRPEICRAHSGYRWHGWLAPRGQRCHPAFGRSISTLRGCGITVILDPGHLPDDDHPGQAEFPWDELRAALGRMRAALTGAK